MLFAVDYSVFGWPLANHNGPIFRAQTITEQSDFGGIGMLIGVMVYF